MSVQRAESNDTAARGVPDNITDGFDFRDMIGILLRRKGWVVGVTAAFCTLAASYILTARPSYTATSQVYVDPRDRQTPKDDVAMQNSVPGDGMLLVESQLKIITSGEVLSRVVSETDLTRDPEFNGTGGLGANIKALFGIARSEDPALAAIRNLRQKTTAKRNDRSFVIDISVSADTAARAAKLANAVANAYLEEQANANAGFNRRVSEAITTQLERMRNAVSQSEQAVTAYKAANNLVGARNRLVTEQELDEANTQLTNARARLTDAQARVKLIEQIEAGGASLDALPEAVQSQTMAQLRAQAANASREEAQLAQINGPSHPLLQAARAQVRDAQAAIKSEVRLIAQAVRNAAASERTNVQNLQARFDTLKTLSQTNEKAIVPLRELERKADSDRAIYENFLAKAKTASEQQVIDTTNARLISRASPPDRKSWPPSMIIMAAALFGGLFLGIVAALARESLAARPVTSPEPETPPQISPPAPAPSPAPTRPQAQLARVTAELAAAPKGHSVLLVRASADPSLGLVALELARALEEAGQNTLIIDADLRGHRVTSRLRFDGRTGLRELLAHVASMRDAAHRLGKTNIHIVPTGTVSLRAPDQQMREALSSALRDARQFDRVIIDGGELGTTSSEYGLYAMVDEVILLETGRDAHADDVQVVADLLQHRRIKARTVLVDPAPDAVAA
ncbi:chain-length determining protein [Rhodopseudomonas boonkerdii]|uniref:GumC family protein n=1 Tax=Rhodopseudomonas boonkerdii TaxID=475937 RepID=UPI001E568B3E|nr:exopolysaccharide transport family protein [Rhodopseudomonas boonkerdii]UGV25002.1 chain-length determining protein [Rhodopseudomonas boonkerdii]